MCENEQKPEPDQVLQSFKTHSSGARAGATFMNRGSSEPELCHFYDSSAALFLSKHILEVSSVGCAPQCVQVLVRVRLLD